MESLDFEHMNSRYRTIRKADPGTCVWAQSHIKYKAWLEPKNIKQHRGLLWIHGKPGVGKSTLMKFLYGKHKMSDQDDKSLTASFFFNARGGSLEHSVMGMYRSLLYRLLETFEDLRNVLDDDHLPRRLGGDLLPLEALEELFSQAIRGLKQRSFTCFVDALDECEDEEVNHMIHSFNRLTAETSAQGMEFRVCFSHRHYPRIKIHRGVEMTIENELGHDDDLSKYISSRLQVASPYPFVHVRKELLAKADGIFLWVVLVVEILNKASNRGEGNLQSKLNVIPTGLTELFQTILDRDNEHPEDLLFSILWILFARRPLKRKEFYHALLAGRMSGETVSPEILIDGGSVTDETIDNFVISSSKGLTQVAGKMKSRVEFVHESVRDFLIRDDGFQQLWPDLSRNGQVNGHEMLAKCCITYLNHPSVLALFREGPSYPSDYDPFTWRYEDDPRYPFLSYAMKNLFYHVNAIPGTSTRGRFITTAMTNQYIQGWLEAEHYYRSQSPKDRIDGINGTTIPLNQSSDLLCYFVYHHLPRLIRAWLEHDPDFKFIVDGRRNPLTEALKLRDKDVVTALLGLPTSSHDEVEIIIAVLNPRHGEYECSGTLTTASRYGLNVVIDMLIKRGSLVDEREQQAKTSLMIASEYGQASAVERLLEHGADINARDENGLTPLLLALRNGHRRVAMSLVEHDARIDLRDKDGTTALVLAASKGFEEIACCLIDKGAQVDICGIQGSDPLIAALQGGHHSTAKLFTEGTPSEGSTECCMEESTLKKKIWRGFWYYTEGLFDRSLGLNQEEVDRLRRASSQL